MLNQSNNHLSEFPKDYKFWEGKWDVVWFYNNNGEFQVVSKSIHKNYSTLNGKLFIESAEGKSEDGTETFFSGFSMRYFNKKFDGWVMIQNWPSAKGNSFSTLAGKFDRRRIEVFTYEMHKNIKTKVKYTFSNISNNYYRWDKQHSMDDGKTWELINIVHGDKISEIGEIDEFAKNHIHWSYLNGDDSKEKNFNFSLTKGRYFGTLTENETIKDINLDICLLSSGYAYLLHFTYVNENLNPNQELIHISRGTVRKTWNLVMISNDQNDHITLSKNENEKVFTNDETLNKLTYGNDVDFHIEIENENSEFNLVISSGESEIIKSYKLEKSNSIDS